MHTTYHNPLPLPSPPSYRQDWGRTVQTGVQGDTWPSTWAEDGTMYAMGCDNSPPGVATMEWQNWWRVDGAVPAATNLTLLNGWPVAQADVVRICGRADRVGNIKPSSVIALGGGLLVAGVQCMVYHDTGDPSFPGRQRALSAWLITSTDGGRSWDINATPSHAFFSGRLTNPMFIQAGRGNAEAPDKWLCVSAPPTNSSRCFVMFSAI